MFSRGSKARHMALVHDLENRLQVMQVQKQAEIDQLREKNILKVRQLELEAQQKNLQASHEHQQKLEAIKSEIRLQEMTHEQNLKQFDIEKQKLTDEFKLKLEELGLKGQELQNNYDLEMTRIEEQREDRKLRCELMHKLIDQNLPTSDFLVKAIFTSGIAIESGTLEMVAQMLQAPHNPAILQREPDGTRQIENTRLVETDEVEDEETTSDIETHGAV